jgi:hypothetical protein
MEPFKWVIYITVNGSISIASYRTFIIFKSIIQMRNVTKDIYISILFSEFVHVFVVENILGSEKLNTKWNAQNVIRFHLIDS